jgi:hypothetical protein
LRRAIVYRDLEQQFLRSFIGTSALNAFKVSDLALQNFDLAGIRIDAADLRASASNLFRNCRRRMRSESLCTLDMSRSYSVTGERKVVFHLKLAAH